jgi:MscS family membrane protein
MHQHRRTALVVALTALVILGGVTAAGQYVARNDGRIRALLPELLLRQGPFGVHWWQWLALPALVCIAVALGRLLARVSRTVLRTVSARTVTSWDDRFVLELAPALGVVWSVLVAAALLPALALTPSPQGVVTSLLAAGLITAIAWVLWRAVFVVWLLIVARPSVAQNPSARSLIGVGAVLTRGLIAVVAVFAVAGAFGYPLNTALAGLGIGGIAVALGAQNVIQNLFGSLSLGIDQPFHVHDLVTVDGITGTVERVGLRSTRFRTADRTLVTFANGTLANLRIESLTARDRIRLALTLSLAHSSTRAQTTRVIDGVKRVLRSHPRIWPETIVVALAGLGPWSMDIEIVAWFATTDYGEFRACREEVFLEFLDVIEEAGTTLAWQPRSEQVAAAGHPA